MHTLDPHKFIYALAGAMLADDWERSRLQAAIARVSLDRPMRVPKLGDRTCSRFSIAPDFSELSNFLAADRGLIRAIARWSAAKPSRKSSSLRKPQLAPKPANLALIEFPQIRSTAELSSFLQIDIDHLHWLADVAGRNRHHPPGPLRTYRYQWVPRPGRASRLIEIPIWRLKTIQQTILHRILDLVPPHTCAHGFVKGRSIITNARPHCGKSVVIKLDLRDFFPSVTSARIRRIFRTLGFPIKVSELLTGLCTTQLPTDVWESRPTKSSDDYAARLRFRTRHLPQGAPTSPALANLAAHRLDRRLFGLAKTIGATYTRYADDLTFSGGAELGRSYRRLVSLATAIAADEGFAVNHRKTKIARGGVRQQVAGVIVNEKPNVSRQSFDQIKAILTNCIRHGPASQNRDGRPFFQAYLRGLVAHVGNVNPAKGARLQEIFKQIDWQEVDS